MMPIPPEIAKIYTKYYSRRKPKGALAPTTFKKVSGY